jgi:hypothetical protein
LDIPEGPFRRAVYYHSGVGSDPEIRQITFWFRNPAAAQYVRREAISNLGTENVESRTLGKIIEWPEIEGARVQIDMSTYTLINPDRFS